MGQYLTKQFDSNTRKQRKEDKKILRQCIEYESIPLHSSSPRHIKGAIGKVDKKRCRR